MNDITLGEFLLGCSLIGFFFGALGLLVELVVGDKERSR